MQQFRFVGGHPALDFINTVGGRTHTSATRYTVGRERLESAADLDRWIAEAKLEGARTRKSRSSLEHAIALREALYRIFKALSSRRPDAKDVAILNRVLGESPGKQKLAFTGTTASLVWEDDEPDPIWLVARSAAELLTSPDVARVRACGGEDCGWMFLDTSRNHSRQWCDMRDCGNVAKVRRFREKERRRPGG